MKNLTYICLRTFWKRRSSREVTMNRIAMFRWLTAPVESTLLQVPRALAASCLAAAVDVACYVLLVKSAGLPVLPAATLSYLLGALLQYLLCSFWVFPASPQSAPAGFASFTLLSLVGLGITWVTLAVFHDLAHVNYLVAKVTALGLAFAWNFLSRKYLLFSASTEVVQRHLGRVEAAGAMNAGAGVS
jgi:putative flippase GtrA